VSTYDDNERSVSQNRPIDLYTITTPTKTYRLTSHVVDVFYAGNTYTTATASRGNLQISQDLTGREMIVYLPISHELVQRFCATGIPEHGVQVTLLRMQQVSGQAIQQWSGFAQSIAIDGHTALVRVPSVSDDAMKIRLPVISAQRLCNHTLYDSLCALDRAGFAINPPTIYIAAQSGNTVTLSTIAGRPDHHFQFGEALHDSGQRRMVIEQVGAVLTLNAPFVGANNGDGLIVYAGCDHAISTCFSKFGNVANFGGMPDLNASINPWAPKGLGIVTQV
jgi:uncharacterized phage protein (TIGR02218 family)